MQAKDAAEYLGVNIRVVRGMVKRGDIEAKKIDGKSYDLSRSSVEAMKLYLGKLEQRRQQKRKKKEVASGPIEQRQENGKQAQNGNGEQSSIRNGSGFFRGKWWF